MSQATAQLIPVSFAVGEAVLLDPCGHSLLLGKIPFDLHSRRLPASVPYCRLSEFWLWSLINSRFYHLDHCFSFHFSCHDSWQFSPPLIYPVFWYPLVPQITFFCLFKEFCPTIPMLLAQSLIFICLSSYYFQPMNISKFSLRKKIPLTSYFRPALALVLCFHYSSLQEICL